MIVMDNYAVMNKNFMQTIFEVSTCIQPAAGYLVNSHLSIPIIIEFSKLIVVISEAKVLSLVVYTWQR